MGGKGAGLQMSDSWVRREVAFWRCMFLGVWRDGTGEVRLFGLGWVGLVWVCCMKYIPPFVDVC